MRKNARKVIEAFNEGKPFNGQTIYTDGSVIFSYRMAIAEIRSDGSVWILPYENAPSATTKSHIRAVLSAVKCRHTDCNEIPGMSSECIEVNRNRP